MPVEKINSNEQISSKHSHNLLGSLLYLNWIKEPCKGTELAEVLYNIVSIASGRAVTLVGIKPVTINRRGS